MGVIYIIVCRDLSIGNSSQYVDGSPSAVSASLKYHNANNYDGLNLMVAVVARASRPYVVGLRFGPSSFHSSDSAI